MRVFVFFLTAFFIGKTQASCIPSNIYRQLNTYRDSFKNRDQNFGTCYAESATYAYNVSQLLSAKPLHPLSLVPFTNDPDDTYSIDGGYLGDFSRELSDLRVCPQSSIDGFVSEFSSLVSSLMKKKLTSKGAEGDLIAILQAIYIIQDRDLSDDLSLLQDYKYILDSKSSEKIYVNVLDDAGSYLKRRLSISMPQDNTRVNIVLKPMPNEKFNKTKVNLLKIFKSHYKTDNEYPEGEKALKDFFYKIWRALESNRYEGFARFFLEMLNASCRFDQRVQINRKLVEGKPRSINGDIVSSLKDITTNLKKNYPVRLSVDAVAIEDANEGMHGVVIMGSRLGRAGSCQLLLRNSWGTHYPGTDSCECFNKDSQKYEACYSDVGKRNSNMELVACWYGANKLLMHSQSYLPVGSQR